jgi:putative transposase
MTYTKCCLRQDISLSDLIAFCRKEKDPRAKERLLALIQIKKGKTTREVGDLTGRNWSTIAKIAARFNQEGFDGLRDKPKDGRPKKAGNEAFGKIKEDLAKSPIEFGYKQQFWSPKLLRIHLEKNYETLYTERHSIRLMRQFDYSIIKPRPADYRKDPAKKQVFKDDLKKTPIWVRKKADSDG